MMIFQRKSLLITPVPLESIDGDSPLLNPSLRKKFMSAVGCLTWLVNTGRPDVAYAHSRVAQHMAKPNESAWRCVVRIYSYLKGSKKWCLGKPLDSNPIDLNQSSIINSHHGDELWRCYTDTDYGGNKEEQNNLRSQNGIIITENSAAVYWGSKVSSVCFAHPKIGEAHPDCSSGAVETFGAGNATYDCLHVSYSSEEMGIRFDTPFDLLMDNTAAEVFAKNSAFKSRMKHIDARQRWVKVLRDRNIVTPKHIDTKLNIADIFTKIFTKGEFERLRALCMVRMPDH